MHQSVSNVILLHFCFLLLNTSIHIIYPCKVEILKQILDTILDYLVIKEYIGRLWDTLNGHTYLVDETVHSF